MLRAVSCIPIENTTSHPVVYRLASLGVEPSPGVSYHRFMHTGPGWRATGACGGMGVCICVHEAVGGRCPHACVLLRRRLDAVVYSAHIAYYHTQLPSPTTATSPNNEDILEHFGGLNANSLVHLLLNNTDNDEPDFMQLSSYHDDDSLNTLFNIKADSFSILSLNCQSLNAKFDQINIKVQQLRSEGHEFKVICLQETWLSDDSETALFQIQGYNFVQHGKQCSAHGGLAIYISTKLNFSTVDININAMSNLTNTNIKNHPGYQMACCVLYHTEINFI